MTCITFYRDRDINVILTTSSFVASTHFGQSVCPFVILCFYWCHKRSAEHWLYTCTRIIVVSQALWITRPTKHGSMTPQPPMGVKRCSQVFVNHFCHIFILQSLKLDLYDLNNLHIHLIKDLVSNQYTLLDSSLFSHSGCGTTPVETLGLGLAFVLMLRCPDLKTEILSLVV